MPRVVAASRARARVARRDRGDANGDANADALPTRARADADGAGLVFAPARDAPGAFDEARVGAPVVKAFRGDDATRWTMWYAATSADGDDSIAIATSTDGVRWRRGSSDAVMYRNDVDEMSVDVGRVFAANDEDWWTFDTRGAQLGDVQLISSDSISGGSVYWMFYHGYDRSAARGAAAATTTTRPGLAFSQDGRNWARFEGEHHTGAVFDRGEDGEWDARRGARSKGFARGAEGHTGVLRLDRRAHGEIRRRFGAHGGRLHVSEARRGGHLRPRAERFVR